MKIVFILNSACALGPPATAERIWDDTVGVGAVIATTP
jgi:hypothetical protein